MRRPSHRLDRSTGRYVIADAAPGLAGHLELAAALVRTVRRWRGLPRLAATETTRRAGITSMVAMHGEVIAAACRLLAIDEAQLLARFPTLAMPAMPTPRAAAA
jgi:hypothetical protein